MHYTKLRYYSILHTLTACNYMQLYDSSDFNVHMLKNNLCVQHAYGFFFKLMDFCVYFFWLLRAIIVSLKCEKIAVEKIVLLVYNDLHLHVHLMKQCCAYVLVKIIVLALSSCSCNKCSVTHLEYDFNVKTANINDRLIARILSFNIRSGFTYCLLIALSYLLFRLKFFVFCDNLWDVIVTIIKQQKKFLLRDFIIFFSS